VKDNQDLSWCKVSSWSVVDVLLCCCVLCFCMFVVVNGIINYDRSAIDLYKIRRIPISLMT
jgi:hypothetical protein